MKGPERREELVSAGRAFIRLFPVCSFPILVPHLHSCFIDLVSKVLDLHENKLATLPEDIGKLVSLQVNPVSAPQKTA